MAISKITLNGVIQMDLTGDTVTAQTLLDDYVAHGADGNTVTGELVMPTARTASDVTVSGATVTIPSGAYASQVQKSVASGTAGTPTASKGAVNNHSIAVTPSVTNTTGYITGSTKTGTAVTVTASELASGNKNITANGSNIDVVGYSTVSVAVQSGVDCPIFTVSGGSITCNKTYQECDDATVNGVFGAMLDDNGLISALNFSNYIGSSMYYTLVDGGLTDIVYHSDGTITQSNGSWMVESLNATANGTYTPTTGGKYFYDSATVNVSGGASNCVQGTFTTQSTGGVTQTIIIPYSGSGYPVRLTIAPTGGFYGNTDFYDLIQRYVTVTYCAIKADTNTLPVYSLNGVTTNQSGANVMYTYKNSTSNSVIVAYTGGTPIIYTGTQTAYANTSQVVFKNATTMCVFVASTSYGFAPSTEYTYQIVYSE